MRIPGADQTAASESDTGTLSRDKNPVFKKVRIKSFPQISVLNVPLSNRSPLGRLVKGERLDALLPAS